MEDFKMKRKKGGKIGPSGAGIWTSDFWTIFPPLIWIFTEGEGEEIKCRRPFKRYRT